MSARQGPRASRIAATYKPRAAHASTIPGPGPAQGSWFQLENGDVYCATGIVARPAQPKDGRLIAAAPDLLAALEAVERVLDASLEAAGVLRAAIAKARGTP